MLISAHRSEASSAVHINLNAIFVSLELSQSKWLLTSLSPGAGEKMSKFMIAAGDVAGLLEIPAVQDMIATLGRELGGLSGRLFTVDAMHAQKNIRGGFGNGQSSGRPAQKEPANPV